MKPDYTYDVSSYHAYLQKYPFIDKVNFDFFPGRIFCAFLFPLADRMYYIVRYFLGYRVGPIVSLISMVALFYQIKKILKLLTNNSSKCSLLTYTIFGISTYMAYMGSYYIDNVGIVFILQIFLVAIENDMKVLENKNNLYYIFLLAGISIGIKITNCFFIIPIFVYLIIKNAPQLRKLNFLDYIICILLVILPYITYLLDSYRQTGSPLFPYYNSIFKSEYFGLYNWMDDRFTLSKVTDMILWPLILVFKTNIYGDEFEYVDVEFAFLYVFVVFYMIYLIIKKKRGILFDLSLISLVEYVLWIIALKGYRRYGTLVPILFLIVFLSEIIQKIEKIKIPEAFSSLKKIYYYIGIASVVIAGCTVIAYSDYRNLKYVFKDNEISSYQIQIDGVWGAAVDDCAMISFVREEGTPIYSLHREYFEDSEVALKMWEEKIKNNDIYTIIPIYYGETHSKVISNLEDDNFYIDEIIKTYTSNEIPFIDANSEWQLVKLTYNP